VKLCTFLRFFFQNPKNTTLRFFEWLTTFSRTLVLFLFETFIFNALFVGLISTMLSLSL